MAGNWIIESFSASRHYCEGLSCGKVSLDNYLKHCAHQENNFGLNKTYVAYDSEAETVDGNPVVLGYYTICIAVLRSDIAARLGVKNPKQYEDLGVFHLGRIATDVNVQGEGLGKQLMVHMMENGLHAADIVGACGINLFAEDDIASFYIDNFGFKVVKDDVREKEKHLFIAMNEVRAMFEEAAG